MKLRSLSFLSKAAVFAVLSASASPAAAQKVANLADTVPPPIAREFRGAWIAAVGNIDWPSRPGLSTWQQQHELLAMLNRAVAMHMNAVIFQVRPGADALYQSDIEPWSPFLSGTMGRAPEPYYDPLAFVVREAHARGLEVHAWFNPYRALYPSSPGPVAPSHITRTDPEVIRRYGSQVWMDPGDPMVVARTTRVILDVTKRYDIDAVHIDDYFYPYRETDRRGRTIQFPDSKTYALYRRGGGTLSLDDWRRNNVDTFVEHIGEQIHAVKPWVRFGISPFGIWRPGYPASVRGLDSFVEIFADARKWLRNGWVDYLVPQLYWPIGRPQQDFSSLLAWWVSQNEYKRNIYAGLNASLADNTKGKGRGASELTDQIRLTRAQQGASGDVFFSMTNFMQDPDSVAEKITRDSYSEQALPPASPWLDAFVPGEPQAVARLDMQSGEMVLDLDPASGEKAPWLWAVQAHLVTGWSTQILPGTEDTHLLAARGERTPREVWVYAVGRTGNLSRPVRVFPNGDPLPLN
ncbi:MAG: family 10 glycosylhydrolase [Gemmatimonadaceae bacterium]